MSRKIKRNRLLSMMIAIAMMLSLVPPVMAAEPIDNLWKYMQLRTMSDRQLSLSHSMAYIVDGGGLYEDGDSMANIDFPINTKVIDTLYDLAFTIQNTQKVRLEVYTLHDRYTFSDDVEPGETHIDEMWRATSGADALAQYDPRGTFVGYVHGVYNGNERTFNGIGGDDGDAQTFYGYHDTDAPVDMMTFRGLVENLIIWDGTVVPTPCYNEIG